MGATVAFDSRYINESDNTAIQTWSDRSGNAINLTQATSTKRPAFRTGVQGGCGVMRFDGTDDSMATASYNVTNTVSGMYVYKNAQTSEQCVFERSANYNNFVGAYSSFVGSGTVLTASFRNTFVNPNSYAAANFTTRTSNFEIFQYNYAGSAASHFASSNGSLMTKTYVIGQAHSTNSANVATFVGARNNAQLFFNGDLGIFYTIPTDVGDSMRKRMNHHAAYSFKISCN